MITDQFRKFEELTAMHIMTKLFALSLGQLQPCLLAFKFLNDDLFVSNSTQASISLNEVAY